MKKLLPLLLVFTFASILTAQERPPGKDASEPPRRPAQKIYKVNFVIYEQEDGKRINERAYSFPVNTVDGNARTGSVKVGTRVPILSGEKQLQYLDVGLNIECDVTEQADKFIVHSELEISSFALPDQISDPRSGGNPVLRQVRQRFTTVVSPGKPAIATSIDDPNSKKRLQVEVTASRLE